MKIAFFIIILVIILLLIWMISTYNHLVKLKNRVQDQWSQVDVQLKRRFDLIPNIVESVKGYTQHEKETLEMVTNARNSALNAKKPQDEMSADNELTGALTRLFSLTEAYPELKADENFKELQRNLKETEDKIAYARQFYNDVVLKYKNAREVFPTNIIADLLGMKEIAFFEVKQEEKENIKVEF